MTMRPPSPTTARAMAAPIPRAPPLTSTVLSSSLPTVSPFLFWHAPSHMADQPLLLLLSSSLAGGHQVHKGRPAPSRYR
jgi:hypothetical protein